MSQRQSTGLFGIPSLPASGTLWQVPKQEENHSYVIFLVPPSPLLCCEGILTHKILLLLIYNILHLKTRGKTHPHHTNIRTTTQMLGPSETLFLAILRRPLSFTTHPNRHWLFGTNVLVCLYLIYNIHISFKVIYFFCNAPQLFCIIHHYGIYKIAF